jgi:RsiW-degrading membrane proteinase PrsW (M82 family)
VTAVAPPALPDGPIAPAMLRRLARTPAWWLFAVLITIGVIELGWAFGDSAARYPIAIGAAVALFALHGAFLIWVLRRLDYLEPEPVSLLAAALAWGGLVATSSAIRANAAAESILTKLLAPAFVRAWGAAIEGPTNEEILKSLGIVALLLLARRDVNSVMDGVIYGAFIGIGFQEVENIAYSLNAAAAADVDSAGPVWQMFLIRGLLGGAWSHAVYTAIVGAGIAYAVLRRDRPLALRAAAVVAAFATAWAGHFLWNSPLLTTTLGAVGSGPGLVVTMVVKGGLVLGTLLVVIGFARRSEYRTLASHLYRLDDPGLASGPEIRALRTGRSRRTARWNAYVLGGLPAGRAMKHIQRNQADIAARLARVQQDPGYAITAHSALGQSLSGVRRQKAALVTRGVYDVDAYPARSTMSGWLSVVGGLATVLFPPAIAVPAGLFAWRVRRSRARHRTADPRLLTGLLIGLTLLAVWLIIRASSAAQIT